MLAVPPSVALVARTPVGGFALLTFELVQVLGTLLARFAFVPLA